MFKTVKTIKRFNFNFNSLFEENLYSWEKGHTKMYLDNINICLHVDCKMLSWFEINIKYLGATVHYRCMFFIMFKAMFEVLKYFLTLVIKCSYRMIKFIGWSSNTFWPIRSFLTWQESCDDIFKMCACLIWMNGD